MCCRIFLFLGYAGRPCEKQRATGLGKETKPVNQKTKRDNLHDILGRTPPGPMRDVKPLLELLAVCWDEFAGSGDHRDRYNHSVTMNG
jgi:hypothetical protein